MSFGKKANGKKAQGQKCKILESVPNGKKAQGQKCKILESVPNGKKAQEEIVGFTMIIIIVGVIILILLSFSLKSPQKSTVESYEVESFLQAILQKTSECRDQNDLDYLSVRDLMFRCYNNEECIGGDKTCDVLVSEIEKVSNESWRVDKDSPVKGYLMDIEVNEKPFKEIGYGNQTNSAKGSFQELTRSGNRFRIEFKAYY